MKGFGPVRVPTLDRRSHFFTDWTTPRTILVSPGQTILLTRRTDDALRILMHAVFALHQRILVLRFDVTTTDLDGAQLVAANAPVENFRATRARVERPTRRSLHKRHGNSLPAHWQQRAERHRDLS